MIQEKELLYLRERIEARISRNRFLHILGVEEAARIIGKNCLPNKLDELSAAALLHDVTKELSFEEQLKILNENGINIAADERKAPQILHSFSAPYIIACDFPEYASEEIISAVEKHTLGDSNMSVFDEIIFIADYVEPGRTYDSCIKVRDFLFSSFKDGDILYNRTVLHKACIMSIDYTLISLKEKNKFLHPKMLKAREYLNSLLESNY